MEGMPAGRSDIDRVSQIAALEDVTKRGAKGILITPANFGGVVPAIGKARANRARPSTLSFATDNLKAGELIGRYTRAKAEEKGIKPRIAMLTLGGLRPPLPGRVT